ncbi:hypothetical protein [Candidatus Macondimonas diazotrophica]|jgi:hypothetical protein|uniref:Uncharacterized protein n=1 Tax=Candidatus Macondimonas diazotrophica TaxID=2305248 RepID=A0A4Z0F8M4_9GAMM|nr:hypothetical protein [Candidatus Macondimonas diazotrophica]TFZ81625.1 hypothetical protein E4680_11625 [Candidatus Macondimonas diazotrophica]
MSDLKAYAVTELDEGTGDIYFAKSNLEARKMGAAEFNGDELGGLRCVRAPWADDYAKIGQVPYIEKIDAGWWAECFHSGAVVSSDGISWGDEEAFPVEPRIGELYATPEYMWKHDLSKAVSRQIEAVAKHLMAEELRRRLPDARPILGSKALDGWHFHASCGSDFSYTIHQAIMSFAWPGASRGWASMTFREGKDDFSFWVAGGDRDRFLEWVKTQKERRHA